MINRSNYELWFLDFAEGNLPEEKIDSLFSFLKKNQDLQKEFDEFNMVFLDKKEFVFDKKDLLKQDVGIEKIEGLNDFELLAIKKLEGVISKDEEKELNSMISFSNKLKQEALIFEKAKLKADDSIVYQDKEKLKKRSIIPLWVKYIGSIAAVGLLLFFVSEIVEKNIPPKPRANVVSVSTDQNNESKINTTKKIADSKEIAAENTEKTINRKTNKPIIADNTRKSTVLSEKSSGVERRLPVNVAINEIKRANVNLIKYKLPSLRKLNRIEKRSSIAQVDKPYTNAEALSPKQFIIKSVKQKLEIDDNNYNQVNTVKLVSAVMNKAEIGNLNIKKSKDTGRKYLVINIGRFGIERTWRSN